MSTSCVARTQCSAPVFHSSDFIGLGDDDLSSGLVILQDAAEGLREGELRGVLAELVRLARVVSRRLDERHLDRVDQIGVALSLRLVLFHDRLSHLDNRLEVPDGLGEGLGGGHRVDRLLAEGAHPADRARVELADVRGVNEALVPKIGIVEVDLPLEARLEV